MTKAEIAMLQKLRHMGSFVTFRAKERGWTFIDTNKRMDGIRMREFAAKGIGCALYQRCPVLYYTDEWIPVIDSRCPPYTEYNMLSCFRAIRDVVHTVPVCLAENEVFENGGLNLVADMVDLTDYAAVIPNIRLFASELIIGEDVKIKKYGFEPSGLLREWEGQYDLHKTEKLNVKRVKWIQSHPVKNIGKMVSGNTTIESLDLSEVNLKECEDMVSFCSNCSNLRELKLSEFREDCNCRGALEGTPLTMPKPNKYNGDPNSLYRQWLTKFVIPKTEKSNVF